MRLLTTAYWLVALQLLSVSGQDCEYQFTEEPQNNLPCNPYPNDDIRISCTVRGPFGFSIEWVWQNLNGDTVVLIGDSSEIDIQPLDRIDMAIKTSRSRLRVRHLSSRTGMYWCRVRLTNGTLLEETSSRLTLSMQGDYTSQSFAQCANPDDQRFTMVSVKCIHPQSDAVSTPDPIKIEQSTMEQLEFTTMEQFTLVEDSTTTTQLMDQASALKTLYAAIAVVVVFSIAIIILSVILVMLVISRRRRPNANSHQVSTAAMHLSNLTDQESLHDASHATHSTDSPDNTAIQVAPNVAYGRLTRPAGSSETRNELVPTTTGPDFYSYVAIENSLPIQQPPTVDHEYEEVGDLPDRTETVETHLNEAYGRE